MALPRLSPRLSDDSSSFFTRGSAALAFQLALLAVLGCGNQQFKSASTSSSLGLSGGVHGGQQPVAGSSIQMYAVGDAGDGSSSTPLLSTPVLTNGNGQFTLTGLFECPTSSTNVYLTATGGNPGLQAGDTNPNLLMMAALGPCGNLTPSTFISMSELSTVAAVYSLAPFMHSYNAVGNGQFDAQLLTDAFTAAGEMVNTASGAVPGPGVPAGQTVPDQKLRTLANILSTCINSAGGRTGDGSLCGSLFSLTTPSSGSAPTDTVGAMLNIASNPTAEVVPLYLLSPATPPYEPALTSAPTDWTLSIASSTPSPTFSPAPGTYVSSPSITLSDSNPSAHIYYTSDGSTPTTSSLLWAGAFSLPASGIVRAVAVVGGVSSVPVSGTYIIQAPTIQLTPGSVSLTSSQSQTFDATVSGASNTAVTWSLSPAVGTISTAGVYTAPATISAAQTVSVTATSVADSSVSATSTVSLVPSVSVSVNPGSVSLNPSQTQAFSATVANTSNTGVTWSLSPAVGSISAGGLYTAPTTVPFPNAVTITATSVADATKSASASVTIVPLTGTSYYLAPASAGGNDSNNGLSASTPWLTPHHSVQCGDVIFAAASTAYSAANFAAGEWGTVSCPAGNNVAWLKCVTFDACKISVTSGTGDGMRVGASYWGVQGWEISNTAGGAGGGSCFTAVPATTTTSIHHIIFANDVANVCPLGGLGSGNNGNAGVDYLAVLGSIAYKAGTSNTYCGSGISVYEPVASDSLPGTHIYVAGNLSYSSTNPSGCYDGNGIIFDTFDGDQTYMPASYSQQGVIDNNISISNGGVGVRMEYNNAGAGPGHATMIARHNTTWNNNMGTYQYGNPYCGELMMYDTVTTSAFLNIAATDQAGCYGDPYNPSYAYAVQNVDSTSSIYDNVGWSATNSYSQIMTSPGFTYGPGNLFGVNPVFANPTTPGAPACGSYADAPACMAMVIADFTPTNSAAVGYGFQMPVSEKVYDTLFPQWLCNVNLPAGLVTMGCYPGP